MVRKKNSTTLWVVMGVIILIGLIVAGNYVLRNSAPKEDNSLKDGCSYVIDNSCTKELCESSNGIFELTDIINDKVIGICSCFNGNGNWIKDLGCDY